MRALNRTKKYANFTGSFIPLITDCKISFGEEYPQSAMIPRTFCGKSNPDAIRTVDAPIDSPIKNILVSSNYKREIIECLQSYFVNKKKTKCIVYDEDNEIIKMDDLSFVYLTSDYLIDNNSLQ